MREDTQEAKNRQHISSPPLPCLIDNNLPEVIDRPPVEEDFKGQQLDLFRNFLCNKEAERDRLSHTIELWDAIPKYHISRKEMKEVRQGGFLPSAQRTFEFKKSNFKVIVHPGRIVTEERQIEYYPSAREELVEDALRKIAAEQSNIYFINEKKKRSGVSFSIRMLSRELGRRGHGIPYKELIESLLILSGCTIELRSSDGRVMVRSPILPVIGATSRTQYLEDRDARWYADFSPMVTASLEAMTYRQYNYATMMTHRSQLARWLHKRLAHLYTNASMTHPYGVRFSTLQRDSGLLEYRRVRDGIRKLEQALEELKAGSVLTFWEKHNVYDPKDRRKVVDVQYKLYPAQMFTGEVKAANKQVKDARDSAVHRAKLFRASSPKV